MRPVPTPPPPSRRCGGRGWRSSRAPTSSLPPQVRRPLAIALIVCAALAGARGGGESPLLAGVSILFYLIGFALLSSRPTGFADKTVVILASPVLLLSLVITFWARNAGDAALTRASGLSLNTGGLAVIALLGLHLMRAALRHIRQ